MTRINEVLVAIVVATVLVVSAPAQENSKPSVEELQKRIEELEVRLQTMSRSYNEQLGAIKTELSRLGGKEVKQATAKFEPAVDKTSSAVSEKPVDKPSEPQQKQDLGINVGSARITPYGTVYFNAFSNSSGTNNTDVPLWASASGGGNAGASLRQTRLGLKIDGGSIGKAKLSGVIEADFYGGFPAIGIGDNFGVVRIRLANARFDWEKTSLTAGQDWMVFAPQNPTSLAAAGIPQLAAAGNNWARLPQVKVEHRFGSGISLQGALLAPQTGDSPTSATFLLQPNSGASSSVPFIQARLAYAGNNWLGTKKVGTIGLSGHYGRSRVFTGTGGALKNDIDSVGVALDWNFPLAKGIGLLGEAFFGRDLGGFQAGVFQGFNNDFAYRVGSSVVPGGVRAIGTYGGWVQLSFTPPLLKDKLSFYASTGLDDPKDADLVSVTTRDWRVRNFAFAFNSIYKITPQFSIGAEVRSFRTNYFSSGVRWANHVNLAAAYSF